MRSLRHSRRFALLACVAMLSACGRAPATPRAAPPSRVQAAAPGRLEGCERVVDVGASTTGVLARVFVAEGDTVSRGQPLAEIGCADWAADVGRTADSVQAKRDALTRLLRGARDEERAAAAAQVNVARAARDQAEDHHARTLKLYERDGVVSRESLVQAEIDLRSGEARLEEAEASRRLTAAAPLPEDVSRLRAELSGAEHELAEARERLRRCSVTSPSDGVVLRALVKPGEAIGAVPPTTLFRIADLRCWRVRAEVDERDIARIAVGDEVEVTADALGDRILRGKVSELALVMGRRGVHSVDPAEKADRDVREVVATIDECAGACVVGLRVNVRFEGKTSTSGESNSIRSP